MVYAVNLGCQSMTSSDSESLRDVKTSGLGGGEERTDFIRVSSPTSKPAELGAQSSSSACGVWKRVFISKIEKRLARDVMERLSVRWEEDKEVSYSCRLVSR